jgi:hypothetical protein
LALGVLAALAIVTAGAAVYQATPEEQALPLDSSSSTRNGARALWLWLQDLGYEVSDEIGAGFRPPENADVALLLEPLTEITTRQWATIDDWVEQGGTLILAGDRRETVLAAQHYDFNVTYLGTTTTTLTAQAPLLALPGAVGAHTRACLETERSDYVTLLAATAAPVMVTWQRGAGRVILSTTAHPFTNAGLKEEGNPGLVLGTIGIAGATRTIWFDEWHRDPRTALAQLAGPGDWLRHTPAGRSLLYTAAVIFASLVLRGRRFGRPVPLRKEAGRRAPLEYVTAIANLGRRAGHRQAVLEQHIQHLKRNLGKRYRLDPTLPDEEYVSRLKEYDPDLDAGDLQDLLAGLRHTSAGESEMVHLAARVAAWLKE